MDMGATCSLATSFRPRRRFRHRHTWKGPGGQSATCDYILVSDRSQWQSLRYIQPRTYASDHIMLVGELRGTNRRIHRRYTVKRQTTRYQELPSKRTRLDDEYSQITALKTPTTHREKHQLSWISAQTWELIDRRASMWRNYNQSTHSIRLKSINKQIRRSIAGDRRARAHRVGETIQTALDAQDPKKAWGAIRVWYRDAPSTPPKPTPHDSRMITYHFKELYKGQENTLPTTTMNHLNPPTPVDDTIPSIWEIQDSVKKLKTGRAVGPSGLRR